MGALDGRDAVDLYETEPINQIRQCEPGCAPVKRVGSKEAVAGLGIGQSGKGHVRRGIATGAPCELWRRPDDPLQERCPRLDTKLSHCSHCSEHFTGRACLEEDVPVILAVGRPHSARSSVFLDEALGGGVSDLIGVECDEAAPPAGVHASVPEAPGFSEVAADGRPGRLAVRRDPRSARPGASGKERNGVGETAAGDMHDEIDGAAAGLREVVEELLMGTFPLKTVSCTRQETQLRRPSARTRGGIDVIQDALGVADLPSPDRCAQGRDGGEDDLDQDVAPVACPHCGGILGKVEAISRPRRTAHASRRPPRAVSVEGTAT